MTNQPTDAIWCVECEDGGGVHDTYPVSDVASILASVLDEYDCILDENEVTDEDRAAVEDYRAAVEPVARRLAQCAYIGPEELEMLAAAVDAGERAATRALGRREPYEIGWRLVLTITIDRDALADAIADVLARHHVPDATIDVVDYDGIAAALRLAAQPPPTWTACLNDWVAWFTHEHAEPRASDRAEAERWAHLAHAETYALMRAIYGVARAPWMHPAVMDADARALYEIAADVLRDAWDRDPEEFRKMLDERRNEHA